MERRGRPPAYGLYRTDILEVLRGRNFVIPYGALAKNPNLVLVKINGKDYFLDSRIASGISDETSLNGQIEKIQSKKYHVAYSIKNYSGVATSKANPIIGQMSNPLVLSKIILTYLHTKGIDIQISLKKRGRKPKNLSLLEERVKSSATKGSKKILEERASSISKDAQDKTPKEEGFLDIAREAFIELGYGDPKDPCFWEKEEKPKKRRRGSYNPDYTRPERTHDPQELDFGSQQETGVVGRDKLIQREIHNAGGDEIVEPGEEL